ncbi:MAG TPA: FAD-dependent oxidoreductase [Spirochaetia bacterium]|nr:FAD-dependent oxidoreductase [Spirochaetia bacterium]
MMRLVVIGGVAGGATAAARARRISETAEITIVERGPYVSFANCGLPYHIAGDVSKRSRLLLQTPEGFDSRYSVKVLVETEALEIDRTARRVRVRGPNGESALEYDKLILAQGGRPIVPPVDGVSASNVFTIWTVPDMDRINEFIEKSGPSSALIAGGGFVGLEMAEAFTRRGLATTIVELTPRLMPTLDPELGSMIMERLESHGVGVILSKGVRAVHPREVELSDGSRVPGEIVLLAVGVRPETTLARAAGLALGRTGAVLVDERMRTSDPDIFAVGDMVEIVHRVLGTSARVPLAGPANRQGRVAASNALGVPMTYAGALGTSVVKIFNAAVAGTGLTETNARSAGIDVGAAVVVRESHAGYYPDAREMYLKIVYERGSGRLLGAQAFGEEGVDKRIDVCATALAARMTLQDLADLDLAYAPPFSSANDPVNIAAFVGLNDISGFSPILTASSLKRLLGGPRGGKLPLLLDVRTLNEYEASHLKSAVHMPLDELRFRLDELPRDNAIVLYCRSGYRAHLALRILRENGFQNVMNVTGGYLSIVREGGFELDVAKG